MRAAGVGLKDTRGRLGAARVDVEGSGPFRVVSKVANDAF